MRTMFGKYNIRKLLSENYPLLSILVGITLVSISIGPFQNWDTDYELQAAAGVIKWSMPFTTFGKIINQPPLGFYVEALFLRIFGASINMGSWLITLFGLGSTVLVYLIGKELYGNPTGLAAAALFALTPWELVLSRSFLIDAQCLFLSLLCLYVGIFAIRTNAIKLAFVSGVFFAASFLTKYFAVFILIPLLLLYVYCKPKIFKIILRQLTVFIVPAFLCSLIWYQVVLHQGVLYIFHNSDFSLLNPEGVIPSYAFALTFLRNYGLGYFFVVAVVFSLFVFFFFRKESLKLYIFDLICLGTIVPIVIVNTLLGAGLNLLSPYTNAIKYDYFALPFFCLVAGSLVGKCLTLFNSRKVETKPRNRLILAFIVTSAMLLAAILIVDFLCARYLSLSKYLLFKTQMNQGSGYSFFNYTPTSPGSVQMNIQYAGFAVLLSGFSWVSRSKIRNYCRNSFKPNVRVD